VELLARSLSETCGPFDSAEGNVVVPEHQACRHNLGENEDKRRSIGSIVPQASAGHLCCNLSHVGDVAVGTGTRDVGDQEDRANVEKALSLGL